MTDTIPMTHESLKAFRREILKVEREAIVKLSMMIENDETERWENIGRAKNDGYINGSHSGYCHALRDLRHWINRIEMADLREGECEK